MGTTLKDGGSARKRTPPDMYVITRYCKLNSQQGKAIKGTERPAHEVVNVLERVGESNGPSSARRGGGEEVSLGANVTLLALLEHTEEIKECQDVKYAVLRRQRARDDSLALAELLHRVEPRVRASIVS